MSELKHVHTERLRLIPLQWWIAYDNTSGRPVGRGGWTHTIIDDQHYLELDWLICKDYVDVEYHDEFVQAALRIAFNELDQPKVIAVGHERDNTRRKALEAFGFTLDRTIQRHDKPHIMYTLTRNDYVKNSISQGLS